MKTCIACGAECSNQTVCTRCCVAFVHGMGVLVEVTNEGSTVSSDEAQRTGRICYMPVEYLEAFMPTLDEDDLPILGCEPGVIDEILVKCNGTLH